MKKPLLFLLTAALVSITPSGANSEPEKASLGQPGQKEYKAGVEAYQKKDYKAAEGHFRKSVQEGNHNPDVYLYSAHTFMALGQYSQAYQTYEIVTKSFKGSKQAKTAEQGMEATRSKAGAAANASAPPAAPAAAPVAVPAAPGAVGLATRILVIPPMKGHQPCLPATIKAVNDAVAAVPPHLRKLLDDSGASIVLSPNIIDRWPDTVKELDEEQEGETMAEAGGRIYGKEMCVYERAKIRGSMNLKEARAPKLIKQTVLNMCFQVVDDMQNISKSPELRKVYELDKQNVPDSLREKLATFIKEDDWGPRETCSELTGSMLGGSDDYTEDLYRCFPNTKKWLKAWLKI